MPSAFVAATAMACAPPLPEPAWRREARALAASTAPVVPPPPPVTPPVIGAHPHTSACACPCASGLHPCTRGLNERDGVAPSRPTRPRPPSLGRESKAPGGPPQGSTSQAAYGGNPLANVCGSCDDESTRDLSDDLDDEEVPGYVENEDSDDEALITLEANPRFRPNRPILCAQPHTRKFETVTDSSDEDGLGCMQRDHDTDGSRPLLGKQRPSERPQGLLARFLQRTQSNTQSTQGGDLSAPSGNAKRSRVECEPAPGCFAGCCVQPSLLARIAQKAQHARKRIGERLSPSKPKKVCAGDGGGEEDGGDVSGGGERDESAGVVGGHGADAGVVGGADSGAGWWFRATSGVIPAKSAVKAKAKPSRPRTKHTGDAEYAEKLTRADRVHLTASASGAHRAHTGTFTSSGTQPPPTVGRPQSSGEPQSAGGPQPRSSRLLRRPTSTHHRRCAP